MVRIRYASCFHCNTQVVVPETCKVIHTETIQRHGARHLNKMGKLDKAIDFFSDMSME